MVEDIDTPNKFKHWMFVYNIPSNISSLSEGIIILPDGTVVIRNDDSQRRYRGPSTREEKQHRCVFHLYALNVSKTDLSFGTGRYTSYDDLEIAMKPFILQEANLTGTHGAITLD